MYWIDTLHRISVLCGNVARTVLGYQLNDVFLSFQLHNHHHHHHECDHPSSESSLVCQRPWHQGVLQGPQHSRGWCSHCWWRIRRCLYCFQVCTVMVCHLNLMIYWAVFIHCFVKSLLNYSFALVFLYRRNYVLWIIGPFIYVNNDVLKISISGNTMVFLQHGWGC